MRSGGRAVPNEPAKTEQNAEITEQSQHVDARTRRKVLAPFVLVLVSLLSVVAAALFVERRTAGPWNEIAEIIDPARTTLGEIKLDLAL
jgi:hypothetical protein